MSIDSKSTFPERFDPETIMALRALFLDNSTFATLLSTVFVFEVVIDANMMVSDILARRRHQGYPSNNERLVAAGILKLHVPSGAITEMETRTLPKVAKKRKIPLVELLVSWRDYQSSLIIHAGYDYSRGPIVGLNDPDDEIYVQLMEDIEALGVLTFDAHFDFLELRAFNHDVLKDIRSYTIAITNSLHLQFGGVFGLTLTGRGLLEILKALIDLWKRAPVFLQIVLVGVVCFAIWHEPSRKKIIKTSKLAPKLGKPILSGLSSYVDMISIEKSRAESLRQGITYGRTTSVA